VPIGEPVFDGHLRLSAVHRTSVRCTGTALHSSKDFAVSLPMLPPGLAKHITSYVLGASCLSAFGVSARTSRSLPASGRGLPATVLPISSTAGDSKSSILGWGGMSLADPRDAQFCNCLRQTKLASVRTFLSLKERLPDAPQTIPPARFHSKRRIHPVFSMVYSSVY